jgi:hypothetical protein
MAVGTSSAPAPPHAVVAGERNEPLRPRRAAEDVVPARADHRDEAAEGIRSVPARPPALEVDAYAAGGEE